MFKSQFFQRYLLPGFVFQSLVIAGGYGTGRELVEFFLRFGPLGGLLAMLLVSTVLWSLVCAATFEFARHFNAFDYRSFFQKLLGRAWFLYEICYLILMFLVLAVIASAAGSILQETFAINYLFGVLGMMAVVGILVFKGSEAIEKFLSAWSLILYAVYIAVVTASFFSFGSRILAAFSTYPIQDGWLVGGIEYAGYNLGTVPAVLFCIRHATRRSHTVVSGLLAGPIAIIPGLLFYLAMAGQYPEIMDRPVPANFLLEILDSRTFQLLFQTVLFGTLIETGTGMIHAFNERIAGLFRERDRSMPQGYRVSAGLTLLAVGVIVAQFGLIDLIAKGYGTITWGFLLVYVAPILTLGIWKILKTPPTVDSGLPREVEES